MNIVTTKYTELYTELAFTQGIFWAQTNLAIQLPIQSLQTNVIMEVPLPKPYPRSCKSVHNSHALAEHHIKVVNHICKGKLQGGYKTPPAQPAQRQRKEEEELNLVRWIPPLHQILRHPLKKMRPNQTKEVFRSKDVKF